MRVHGVKSFHDSGDIVFSKGINLFVAPNNAGKTTLLRCLYALQKSAYRSQLFPVERARYGETPMVEIEVSDIEGPIAECYKNVPIAEMPKSGDRAPLEPGKALIILDQRQTYQLQVARSTTGTRVSIDPLPQTLPNCWIFPFLGRRKNTDLREEVTANTGTMVDEIAPNLYARIDRLIGLDSDGSFTAACRDILQIPIGTVQSQQGKTAGCVLNKDGTAIASIQEMGEGTRNIAQLLVDLWLAEKKLFLLEEPENDVHPAALKKLLSVILEKAESNQFIVSTHSNIVAKTLGGRSDAKLFTISMRLEGRLPTSTISLVDNTPEGRIRVLEDLGYDVFDYDLWKGYLILEESSAERIINDLLIPEFAPALRYRLRTIVAGGITKVQPRFEDFHRLFVFIHTSPAYKNRGWILVDGDEEGIETVKALTTAFSTWDARNFRALSKEDFELYFPSRFQPDVDLVLARPKTERREAKKKLLNDVLTWIREDRAAAIREFGESAKEVIEFLREIEKVLGRSA